MTIRTTQAIACTRALIRFCDKSTRHIHGRTSLACSPTRLILCSARLAYRITCLEQITEVQNGRVAVDIRPRAAIFLATRPTPSLQGATTTRFTLRTFQERSSLVSLPHSGYHDAENGFITRRKFKSPYACLTFSL